VQCIDDGGLVAAITERVCPTAAVGRLAAGDRVVRSCRGACLAEALVGRSGRGSAASGRVLGRGGIGKTRLLEAFSDAAESVGTGAFGTVAGAGECTTVLAVGAAIQGRSGRIVSTAVARLAQIRKKRVLFHPVARTETTHPRSAGSLPELLLKSRRTGQPWRPTLRGVPPVRSPTCAALARSCQACTSIPT
jgi:hypothetical protein